MNNILLDGVGAGFFLVIFLVGLVFITIAIFIEAFVMQQMKYHPGYKKCLLQSLVANLVSLAAGFVIIETEGDFFQINNFTADAILLGASLVLEGLVLFLMNRNIPFKKTAAVTLVMNLVTYAIAFLFILALR